MDVQFTAIKPQAAVARWRRSDGAVIETVATSKNGLPHDLEHLIVERAVRLQSGFWGRVAAGAEFRSMSVSVARPRKRARSENRVLTREYSGWSEDLVGKVVEAHADASAHGWSPTDPLPRTRLVAALLRWDAPGTDGAEVTEATLHRAFVDLSEARAEWASLPLGASIVREWPEAATRSRARSRARTR